MIALATACDAASQPAPSPTSWPPVRATHLAAWDRAFGPYRACVVGDPQLGDDLAVAIQLQAHRKLDCAPLRAPMIRIAEEADEDRGFHVAWFEIRKALGDEKLDGLVDADAALHRLARVASEPSILKPVEIDARVHPEIVVPDLDGRACRQFTSDDKNRLMLGKQVIATDAGGILACNDDTAILRDRACNLGGCRPLLFADVRATIDDTGRITYAIADGNLIWLVRDERQILLKTWRGLTGITVHENEPVLVFDNLTYEVSL